MVLTSTEDGARNPDDEEPFEALMDLVTRLEDSLVEYRETVCKLVILPLHDPY